MNGLTEAQRWALQAIADGHGASPARLGERMMERPGVEEKRRGGNRNSPQGLGRIGGTMMHRLYKLGAVTLDSGYGDRWHATRAKLTPAGREALRALEGQQ
jgi:hypothetical protein